MTEIADLVGEQLMIGLPGPTLDDAAITTFRETRAAGVILYRRNFETVEQHTALLTELEEKLGRRLLIGTDHEGGRIVMQRQGVTIFPDNLTAATGGDESFVARQGMIEARELRRLGIDLNLGPVLDVLTDRYSPNIGIRSYGKDPAIVARYGMARITGMQRNGVSACAKHFPGKGHSPLDAHLRLPTIESDWDEMHATHLPPFLEAIAAGVDAIMTSHPLYPKLDPTGVPATFSRLIVEEYLRGEVGYRGVIVSDDLEMGAITEICPIGDAAVRAAKAGHDLLLVCHTEWAQRAAAAALIEAYRSGRLSRVTLEQSVARVRRLRERRTLRFEGGPPHAERDGRTLASAMAARAVTVVNAGAPNFVRALNGKVAAIFPRFSDLAPRITIEPEICDERGYLARAFGLAGVSPEITLVGIEPSPDETRSATELARAADATVLFLFDAHLYATNRALLDAVQESARSLAVVLLRDPYDAALLHDRTLGVTAFGFRKCQLDAVIARLCHA